MNESTASAKLERYRDLLSAADFARLVAALAGDVPSAIRVNTLKTAPETALAWAEHYGWQLRPVPFCESGWAFDSYWPRLGSPFEHRMGLYYIQDAASMLPVELFSPFDSQPLILDMAAAPGGKTTHLVSHFQDRGLIIANDSSANRLNALRANLQGWGAFGAAVTNFSGDLLAGWYPDTFDRILLDAPCSGETLRDNKGRKRREVSDKEQAALCLRQSALLKAGFHALKVGGELVYSTCTLAPEENEAVIAGLLRDFPQARLAAVEWLGLEAPALTSHHPDLRHAIRLWPHLYETSGFFAAKLIKTDATPTPSGAPIRQAAHDFGLRRLTASETSAIVSAWRDEFGFDFAPILETSGLILCERADGLYALPEGLLSRFGNLPTLSAGLLAGQKTDDGGYIPSHELISRYDSEFTAPRHTLSEQETAAWFSGYDLREGLSGEIGRVILLADQSGRFVGRAKRLKDRARNLLPKRMIT